jgi:hypothetical protein
MWTGISLLSASMQRKCYLDKGFYQLYPNLFIVLVAASARCRKTTAVLIGYDIYKKALPTHPILAQRLTPEALITCLKDGSLKTGMSGGYIVADELAIFLGDKKDDRIIQMLTKLYDCHDVFDYQTMARGKEVCTNVYLGMLGATTYQWIRTSISEIAIGGGFTSRIIFVYQDTPNKPIAFPSITPEERILKASLINDLIHISNLKGTFVFTDKGKQWYADWYTNIYGRMNISEEGALDGYYGRKHDTMLKVAMCLSVANRDDLTINDTDLMVAERAMGETEKNLPKIIECVLSTPGGDEKSKVLRSIAKRGTMKYADILRSFSYCLDAKRLNEILSDLCQIGSIREEIKEGKRYYTILKD